VRPAGNHAGAAVFLALIALWVMNTGMYHEGKN
jgi:hypothetical protein